MAEEGRDKYLASSAPRVRRKHPARSAQALRTSGAGIVHREMMDLQRQPELNKTETGRLKELRRDWNRNRKYTGAGMSIAGASTPQDAMKYYSDTTEDFRQLNKPSYNQMYPLTGGFMDYADKGGLWGSILSGFAGKTKKNIMDYGKDLLEKKGILGAVDPEETTPEILQNYAEKTFGPNMYDVAGPWLGTAPVEDVEMPDLPKRPLRVQKRDSVDDITESDLDPNLGSLLWGMPGLMDKSKEIPGYGTSYIDMIDPETGEPWGEPWMDDQEKFDDYIERGDAPPPIPFNDAGREAGIATLYGKGPKWGETDRRYEKEYRSHIERTGDRMTYDEFERAWERMHALPKGLHFQEPRAGRR